MADDDAVVKDWHPHSMPGDHLHNLEPDPRRGEEINQQSPGERAPAVEEKTNRFRWAGLVAGLLAAAAVYLAMGSVAHSAKLTAATAVLMGVWWMTEALPIPATALVPLVVFPSLGTDVSFNDVGASYGNSIIFLFMGGFLLALAMQRWNLHRRIALHTVRAMGTKPSMVVAGFMIATGFLSMWVSNTATAVMMLPIGVSVLMLVSDLVGEDNGGAGQDPEELAADANRGVRLLDWDSAVQLPWGVLLLFGGGLALSSQFSSSGLTEWIGAQAQGLGGLPAIALVAVLAMVILFLTELTSNTATAATFLPVAGGIGLGLDLDPMLLTIPVALAATCAFMLPVATPPNAVAYGSGYVAIPQMVKGGLWLNLIGIVLITLTTMTLAVWVFQIVA
ncbi:SLC13 family permease [Luteococcus sp. OSA5]|uniref:SLC13 family permease n=1 Tax=Luteococcus sp. OSA5 TaxID=3401630 RepID=UPI003B435B69